jgi:hypothetical protein
VIGSPTTVLLLSMSSISPMALPNRSSILFMDVLRDVKRRRAGHAPWARDDRDAAAVRPIRRAGTGHRIEGA